MIDTEQTVVIDAPIAQVWAYARNIEGWASLMPGMRECEVIDADTSRWVLKVGVGGLVRTVTVDVHVDLWDGPGRVEFSYALKGDPVKGGGTYDAVPLGPDRTEVKLVVRVEGGGPLAAMWEAMGRPLLPQLAKGFANELKAAIERNAAEMPVASPAAAPVASPAAAPEGRGLLAWLADLLRRLFGSKTA